MKRFQDLLGKELVSFLEECLINEDRILVVNRPPFHNKYRFSFSLHLEAYRWNQYYSMHMLLLDALNGIVHRLSPNSTTMAFHLYSDDIRVFDAVRIFLDEHGTHGSVRIIDKAWWDKDLPAPLSKHKFYHIYNFRIRFVSVTDDLDLNNLQGPHYEHDIAGAKFLYVRDTRDMVLLKLLYHDKIMDIEDRTEKPN